MKLLKSLFLVFIFISSSSFAQETLNEVLKKYNKNEVPYISVTELRMLQLKDKVIILDSREKKEYMVSHLETSTLVGFDNFNLETIQDSLKDKDKPIVVYCTLGIRSELIADKLLKAGFTNVKNLYGGISEWKNKGFKVIDSTQNETNNIHVFSKEWGKWLEKGKPVF